jgi:hypothetical protein
MASSTRVAPLGGIDMRAWLLTLYHADRPDLRVRRVIWRDHQAEAIDGAIRWLRLHRRTSPARKPFDTWSVSTMDTGQILPRIVATSQMWQQS